MIHNTKQSTRSKNYKNKNQGVAPFGLITSVLDSKAKQREAKQSKHFLQEITRNTGTKAFAFGWVPGQSEPSPEGKTSPTNEAHLREEGVRPSRPQSLIRRYIIIGERRLSNYWWAFTLLLGSSGFLLSGLSIYAQNYKVVPDNIYPFLPDFFLTLNNVSFFPQGLLMSFYGCLGVLLSFYWWFLIFWNVGGGFNEFNKKEDFIRIFRWGYPGKNRRIDLIYNLKDVEAIKVALKQGLDSQRTIYLKLKGKREIPLTGIGEPLTLKEIEKQASELANFLQVSLEGL